MNLFMRRAVPLQTRPWAKRRKHQAITWNGACPFKCHNHIAGNRKLKVIALFPIPEYICQTGHPYLWGWQTGDLRRSKQYVLLPVEYAGIPQCLDSGTRSQQVLVNRQRCPITRLQEEGVIKAEPHLHCPLCTNANLGIQDISPLTMFLLLCCLTADQQLWHRHHFQADRRKLQRENFRL